jgi:hypothetical protein
VQFGSSAGNVTVKGVNACGNGLIKTLAVAMPCRLEEALALQPTLYPNPSNGTVHFASNGVNGVLTIVDVTGHALAVKTCGDKAECVITDLPAGILFYRFENENGLVASGKFVVIED